MLVLGVVGRARGLSQQRHHTRSELRHGLLTQPHFGHPNTKVGFYLHGQLYPHEGVQTQRVNRDGGLNICRCHVEHVAQGFFERGDNTGLQFVVGQRQ